jgi:tricarballylate dehydrogenase
MPVPAASSWHDVIVVGGGNAALCAALSAHEAGARVLILERAPEAERGGNSVYTDGLMRFAYDGVDDIRAISPDLTEAEVESADFGAYTESDFFDTMGRITQYRTDPDLCEILVKGSKETLLWMKSQGVRFMPDFGRQAYKVDGKFKFWGGATIAVSGGGPGLMQSLYRAAEKRGIEVMYDAWARHLLYGEDGVTGVAAKIQGRTRELRAGAVVLACGGFEANPEWRTKYLGPGWDLAKVRGTKYNTGDGLAMALDIGAQPFGHWSGCHAVSWERNATEFGDLHLTPQFQRNAYQYGIMVNVEGNRFVDEGADFRNYTYAKYGQQVLRQPGQVAWQICDGQTRHLLRDEYRSRYTTKITAETIEELAEKLDEIDKKQFLKTVKEFNASIKADRPFNPNIKDERRADGLSVPKSNWAVAIEKSPIEAYSVTCGITFTFGGIRVTNDCQVIDTNHSPIKGLFAAGEMIGGIFYFNYPGASGLTSGAVFGRRSGNRAAQFGMNRRELQQVASR